jgi:hypothetical protein
MQQYISYSQSSRKVYDSVRREILHNLLNEFCIHLKEVRLITMRNKINSQLHVYKHMLDVFLTWNHNKILLSQLLLSFALEYILRRDCNQVLHIS